MIPTIIIAETSQMQDAYEQRLQAYRAEIARLSLEVEQSKFDSTSVEGRVIDLGRRQRQAQADLGRGGCGDHGRARGAVRGL